MELKKTLQYLAVSTCLLWQSPASASLAQVESYLSNLKTMVADFKQMAPNGAVSTGKFHLKRPQKMRWQYNPPTPILMVTRGSFLTYYDYELNQISDIPIADTLLGILSQQEISFSDSNLTVVEHYEKDGFETVTVTQTESPNNGSLSMVFSQSPFQLQFLMVTDATQQTTQISLNSITENSTLSDDVFAFRDPRIGGKRKKTDRFNN